MIKRSRNHSMLSISRGDNCGLLGLMKFPCGCIACGILGNSPSTSMHRLLSMERQNGIVRGFFVLTDELRDVLGWTKADSVWLSDSATHNLSQWSNPKFFGDPRCPKWRPGLKPPFCIRKTTRCWPRSPPKNSNVDGSPGILCLNAKKSSFKMFQRCQMLSFIPQHSTSILPAGTTMNYMFFLNSVATMRSNQLFRVLPTLFKAPMYCDTYHVIWYSCFTKKQQLANWLITHKQWVNYKSKSNILVYTD